MTVQEDTVGAGRYIISFLLAGLIGLGIQYALRRSGWAATWINGGIFAVLLLVILSI